MAYFQRETRAAVYLQCGQFGLCVYADPWRWIIWLRFRNNCCHLEASRALYYLSFEDLLAYVAEPSGSAS